MCVFFDMAHHESTETHRATSMGKSMKLAWRIKLEQHATIEHAPEDHDSAQCGGRSIRDTVERF